MVVDGSEMICATVRMASINTMKNKFGKGDRMQRENLVHYGTISDIGWLM
jgi:hypothetical protein